MGSIPEYNPAVNHYVPHASGKLVRVPVAGIVIYFVRLQHNQIRKTSRGDTTTIF
jgi:hypothetical protein